MEATLSIVILAIVLIAVVVMAIINGIHKNGKLTNNSNFKIECDSLIFG